MKKIVSIIMVLSVILSYMLCTTVSAKSDVPINLCQKVTSEADYQKIRIDDVKTVISANGKWKCNTSSVSRGSSKTYYTDSGSTSDKLVSTKVYNDGSHTYLYIYARKYTGSCIIKLTSKYGTSYDSTISVRVNQYENKIKADMLINTLNYYQYTESANNGYLKTIQLSKASKTVQLNPSFRNYSHIYTTVNGTNVKLTHPNALQPNDPALNIDLRKTGTSTVQFRTADGTKCYLKITVK